MKTMDLQALEENATSFHIFSKNQKNAIFMKKIVFFEGFMTRNYFILKMWAVIDIFRD